MIHLTLHHLKHQGSIETVDNQLWQEISPWEEGCKNNDT